MIFTEKLNALMKERRLTRGSLAEKAGIPYNTIVGFYTKGYNNMKLSNVKRLAEFFGVSLDVLCDDGAELPAGGERAEGDIDPKFAELSEKGKDIVRNLIEGLSALEAPEDAGKVTYIMEYLAPAAAGYASPVLNEDYVLVPRGADVPKAADFAARISGDSMEPYIADGSRVFVSRVPHLENGDVGLFFVDGDMKCKQYCEDSFGNIYLFSANRERADADVYISASSGITVMCFGRVLLDKKIPLPK